MYWKKELHPSFFPPPPPCIVGSWSFQGPTNPIASREIVSAIGGARFTSPPVYRARVEITPGCVRMRSCMPQNANPGKNGRAFCGIVAPTFRRFGMVASPFVAWRKKRRS